MLDRLNSAIKAYLTSLDHETIDGEDDQRLSEILAFITNLEHAGDIVERGVGANLAKRAKRNLAFSREGAGEIHEMLQRLATNVRTAAAVFMTDDVRAARELLGEKEVFRDLETRATEAHFARIRAGRVESVETSALHLDMLRDLKRINAHIAAAAYPVLEKRGELLSSRLRQDTVGRRAKDGAIKEKKIGEKLGPRSDHGTGDRDRRGARQSKTSPRTARLISSGLPRMAQKVAEEATEVVIEAVRGKRTAVVKESVDLIYNLVVLWSELGIAASEVWAEMDRRQALLGMAEKLPKDGEEAPMSPAGQ